MVAAVLSTLVFFSLQPFERRREKNINGAICQIKVIFCKAILPIEKKKPSENEILSLIAGLGGDV